MGQRHTYTYRGYLVDVWRLDGCWTWQVTGPGLHIGGHADNLRDGLGQAIDLINQEEVQSA